MSQNEATIHSFYKAFQHKDYQTMQDCYADMSSFSDPVFLNLSSAEVKAMWKMLCENGRDLHIEYKNVRVENEKGSADWIAHYTFSKTGRKVLNKIHAEFEFDVAGKIIRHCDSFLFYKWAKQALGLSGLLLGWTSFLHKKVQSTARESLNRAIAKA